MWHQRIQDVVPGGNILWIFCACSRADLSEWSKQILEKVQGKPYGPCAFLVVKYAFSRFFETFSSKYLYADTIYISQNCGYFLTCNKSEMLIILFEVVIWGGGGLGGGCREPAEDLINCGIFNLPEHLMLKFQNNFILKYLFINSI